MPRVQKDSIKSCYRGNSEECAEYTGELPKMYQYFSAGEVAEALANANVDPSKVKVSNLGGFSASMDFASVSVCY